MPITQRLSPLPPLKSGPPLLIVVVDTEEEFDWSLPHSRAATSVTHMRQQELAQRLFDRYGLKPTYVVDYPIASQQEGYRGLKEWFQAGRCGIGAHLHPWVNPPHSETVSARNSYPGNLPAPLEREKLLRLTEMIEQNFAYRPKVYRAGRYGIGPATAALLDELGYEIDMSIMPRTDFSTDGGPDFSEFTAAPYWFGPQGRLLEIPATAGWCGRLAAFGEAIQPIALSKAAGRLHVPGILARLGLFERVRLTPEGNSFLELRRLTDTMLASGQRIFSLMYHSPTLAVGNTPYVRDQAGLQEFLNVIERYLDYFFGTIGGQASTPEAIRRMLEAADAETRATPHVGEGAIARASELLD